MYIRRLSNLAIAVIFLISLTLSARLAAAVSASGGTILYFPAVSVPYVPVTTGEAAMSATAGIWYCTRDSTGLQFSVTFTPTVGAQTGEALFRWADETVGEPVTGTYQGPSSGDHDLDWLYNFDIVWDEGLWGSNLGGYWPARFDGNRPWELLYPEDRLSYPNRCYRTPW